MATEEFLQAEARERPRIAIVAAAAAAFTLIAALVGFAPGRSPSNLPSALLSYQSHEAFIVASAVLSAVGSILVAFLLDFLFRATRARNPGLLASLRPLAFVGGFLRRPSPRRSPFGGCAYGAARSPAPRSRPRRVPEVQGLRPRGCAWPLSRVNFTRERSLVRNHRRPYAGDAGNLLTRRHAPEGSVERHTTPDCRRGNMHRKELATLVVAMALVAGGCGGGSKPATKADFVKQASAACTHLNARNLALVRTAFARAKAQHIPQNQLVSLVMPQVTVSQQQELKDLEAIHPPDALKGRFAEWKEALRASNKMGPGPAFPPPGSNQPSHAARKALEERLAGLEARLGLSAACQ